MSGSVSKAVEEQAIEYVCDRRFHRRFVLPRTAAHGPLRISYAVAGIDEPNVPTILFMSGMFGGRLNALDIDYLAKKKGLRVICVDRYVCIVVPCTHHSYSCPLQLMESYGESLLIPGQSGHERLDTGEDTTQGTSLAGNLSGTA